MKTVKKKLILVQLSGDIPTIPLAAGYLKAMAYKVGLLRYVDIETTNFFLNNKAGEETIVSSILEKKPFCLGFSCYVWNMEKSIYIINKIKSRRPDIKVICGGCEIASQYKKFIKNKNIDVIVRGEGELTFVELIRSFLFHKPKMPEIKGIIFKKSNKTIVNPLREQMPDINIIPSPYLLGYILPENYGKLAIETYRGCIQRCAFCNWPRNSKALRYFNVNRIRDEIMFALKKKVNVHFMDTIFNLPINLRRLYKILEQFSHKAPRSLLLSVEGLAELFNKETINLLPNVRSVSVGLQSTNPVALLNANRRFNKKLFIRGLGLLKKRGIPYRIDVIVGLPGDTIYSIIKTIHFAIKYSYQKWIYCDILHVSPGTRFRERAREFKLKYMTVPPYYIRSTNTLSHSHLKKVSKIITTLPANFREDIKKFPPAFNISQLIGFHQTDIEEIKIEKFEIGGGWYPSISNFVLDKDMSKQSTNQIKRLASQVSKFVNSSSQILIKNIRLSNNIDCLREFLNCISRENPSTRFLICIQTDRPSDFKLLPKFHRSIVHELGYNEQKEKYFAYLENDKVIFPKCKFSLIHEIPVANNSKFSAYPKEIIVMWKFPIFNDNNWKTSLRKVLAAPFYRNLIIEFPNDGSNLSLIVAVLKYISKSELKDKQIYFSDFAVQIFYEKILLEKISLNDFINDSLRSFCFAVFFNSD